MKKRALLLPFLLFGGSALAQHAENDRWRREARATTIVRDDWGIAHVHGKTDADAVFGMMYAQCEDDFNRVETNYLVSLGRLAEAEGEDKLWQDLRQRLFLDPEDLKSDYARSPAWLKRLMDAWADGGNYFLARHPEVKPRVIRHFEPWMALSFTEGSIGGDTERVNLLQLRAFYDQGADHASAGSAVWRKEDPTVTLARLDSPLHSPQAEDGGSNGFAIAPSNTLNHHALLLINPHTSFFFRSELQMSSDEGLDAYGAVTWGQIFVYQGFNNRVGWMHTSSYVDAVDEFKESLVRPSQPGGTVAYRYGDEIRPFRTRQVTLRYKTPDGVRERSFTTYYNHRGPVVRDEGGQWVTVRLMNKPVEALAQSFLRTKARSYAEYRKTMELFANSSNNTVYADADGNIAYWHGNFIPRRDVHFDYTKPVEGSNPATDWQRLMTLDEIPHLKNPASGYLENVNNWPWSGAGASSLRQADFPAYVDQGTETARGLHAIRVLEGRRDFTLDSLLRAAFDSYLPWFARTIPVLVRAWDDLPQESPEKARLAPQIAALRGWDMRWAEDSIPTSLAIYWGEAVLNPVTAEVRQAHIPAEEYVATRVSPESMLKALDTATSTLEAAFGSWQTEWGKINRFQRINDNIVPSFDDSAPSIPVPFTASSWGSLASFAAKTYPGTRKRYGTVGNSFVAVVEFGEKVRARAVTAGGESGNPASRHFNDEAVRYASGDLRDVYFYPEQLKGHTERTYHPGD